MNITESWASPSAHTAHVHHINRVNLFACPSTFGLVNISSWFSDRSDCFCPEGPTGLEAGFLLHRASKQGDYFSHFRQSWKLQPLLVKQNFELAFLQAESVRTNVDMELKTEMPSLVVRGTDLFLCQL